MKTGRIIFLLAIGVAIVAAGAYYMGLFSMPRPAVSPPANVAGTVPKGSESAAVAPIAPDEGKKAGKSDISAPAFDVVRVEPSGDMVIAGTAEPDSAVEIVTGSNVIANAKADSAGNFAAVLDTPLKPGDYQIVLRATAPDGTVATSTQTAIVSVPADKTGQVLALVEQPGEASRLITKPEADEGANGAKMASGVAGSTAKTSEAGTATQQHTDENGIAASTSANGQENSGSATGSSGQVASTEPAGSSAKAGEKSEYSVAVEAVEIDGGKIFIAGTGKPGLPVMIYANDSLLGRVKVSPVGRFLLETEHDLPVGDYIIRADMLDETGAKVLARAAVPFEREAGKSVAAVAPSAANGGNAGNSQGSSGQAAGTIEHSQMGGEIANTPPTVIGEKLSNVKSSVIIRRGDNLWRISRRVYGRGIRYTTIYLANKDQIRDPDMIWPGQVFTVPKETPEGEKADTTLMEKRWAEKDKKQSDNQ